MIQTIAPCLWFDNKAEEAARFYTSVFPKARIVRTRTDPGFWPCTSCPSDV